MLVRLYTWRNTFSSRISRLPPLNILSLRTKAESFLLFCIWQVKNFWLFLFFSFPRFSPFPAWMLVCVKTVGGLCKWIPTRLPGSKSDALKTQGSSLTCLDHNYGPYVFKGHATYSCHNPCLGSCHSVFLTLQNFSSFYFRQESQYTSVLNLLRNTIPFYDRKMTTNYSKTQVDCIAVL